MINLGSLDYLKGRRILITGGTGSLGRKLTRIMLENSEVGAVIIYSRDEFKQYEMCNTFDAEQQARLRFFLGDVRDESRLALAMQGVECVIHAAALKQIPAAEYNPFEFVRTNVIGAENVVNAALQSDVGNVVALSTDKAANPINLYGATKLCSDKLFVSANSYSGSRRTRFSVVRYGNVMGSRGSVVPFFLTKRKEGRLPVTDLRMTRFWITLMQGVSLVLNALRDMQGGEIWVPKIPSMRIADLARVIGPDCELTEVGIRPGEKLHEVMISADDGRQALEFESHFIIKPSLPFWDPSWHAGKGGSSCPVDFCYASDSNAQWLTDESLEAMIRGLDLPEAREWAEENG